MSQSYADLCIERAGKASEGPWKHESFQSGSEYVGMRNALPGRPFNPDHSDANGYMGAHMFLYNAPKFKESYELLKVEKNNNAEFIAHARTDVPELARRLKSACDALRKSEAFLADIGWSAGTLVRMAELLEAMPEEK